MLINAPKKADDKRLLWHLTYGVLRNRAMIDACLNAVLSRPLVQLDAEVIAALRVGTFEALYSRTKRFAVVDQTVEVVKKLGAKGMLFAPRAAFFIGLNQRL